MCKEQSEYSVYSKFDIQKHKETFCNYLEVIILENGTIEYAVPSHQEFLIRTACKKMRKTREELDAMCPKEYYFDFHIWLSKITNCCMVWNDFVIGYQFNENQIKALQMLKKEKVYYGEIPKEKI